LPIDEWRLPVYNGCMALLITSAICGLFAAAVALVLQFSLPGWLFFAGLGGASQERRAGIDLPRLRRRLSMIFYLLAAGFLGSALFFYLKILSARMVIPVLVALAIVAFNLFWLVYRKMDGNEYSAIARRSGRVYFIAVNVFLVVIFILFSV
jgi:hypothetical protein